MHWDQWQPRGFGLGAGTVPYTPGFFDMHGNPISRIPCGTPYTFQIPGYPQPQIWLDQTFNGKPGYSGALAVPMAPFTSDCSSEVGTYLNTVYTLNPDGSRGQLIGSVDVTIEPGQLAPGVVPTILQHPAAAISGIFASIPLWGWAVLAAGALYVMGGKKRRGGGAGAGGSADLGI